MTSTQNPPKRKIRFHPKARTGCVTCKRRHVKCDETESRCNNCRRRGVECVWKKTNDNQQVLTLYKPLSAPRPIPIGLISLRIMHHYTTITSRALSSDSKIVATARITVPWLSWQSPHLLHALLSFTALHLSRLYCTEPKWVYLASGHRKAAIEALPSADNPDAKFLTIGFFTVYTISSSLSSSPENIFALLTSLHNVWSALEGRRRYGNQRLKILDPLVISLQVDSERNFLGHLHRFSSLSFDSVMCLIFGTDA